MSPPSRCGFGLLVMLLTPGLTHAAEPQPEPKRFAIVIGVNSPADHSLPALQYADDDALRTHELLIEAGVSSVVLVRLDDKTRALRPDFVAHDVPRFDAFERAQAQIREQIRMARAAGAATEFMLVYSGHGDVEHGEGYLTFEDRHLTRGALYGYLHALGAGYNHVIIDACRSYFMAYDRGTGGRRETFMGKSIVAEVPAQLRNTGFILSTSSDRDSHEWDRYEGGILSHEVRSALRGAADADANGKVSYVELAAFLHQANREITNPRFRPEFLVRAPGDDYTRALLSWPTQHDVLHVSTQDWGHFFVETADGDRVLDANPARGQSLGLHVPARRPLYVLRNDWSGEQIIVEPGAANVGAPRAAQPNLLARGGSRGFALEKLFEAPFGVQHVRAYRPTILALNVLSQPAGSRQSDKLQLKESLFESPVFWVSVGVAVVGAAVLTGALLANQTDEPPTYGGTTGISLGAR